MKRVDEVIRQDRRLKLHEIASSLEISETSAHRIVFDELGYRKVSARWVPKQLTDNHKEQKLDICRELLRRSKSSRRVHGYTANAGGDFLGYLFGPLKRELAGKRFDNDEELVDHVRKWLQNLDGSFFREGIYSMVRRWQKCVDRLGCYVEK